MFRDRIEAGQMLARHMDHLRDADVVVLGLPRGGVPVAFEVAQALECPLDVIVVRKLGVPFQPETAMGALGEGGICIINREVVDLVGVSRLQLEAAIHRERIELERRSRLFRGGRERIPLEGRVAVIVDDGIATGSTARAAAQVVRAQHLRRVIVAAPVAPADIRERLRADADEVIVLVQPLHFLAIGDFYVDFSQTSDSEVIDLLQKADSLIRPSRSRLDPSATLPG